MQQENQNPLNYLFLEEEPINIREQIEKYVYHWKWFVLGIALAVLGAYVYLRYTPNQYLVSTTILIDDEKSGGLPSELSAFEDLGLMGGGKKSIDNEIGVLKSRSLMERVVHELGINVTYYSKGRIRASEIYGEKVPFKISFFSEDAIFNRIDTTFTIKALSATQFELMDGVDVLSSTHMFGENISTNYGNITVTPVAIHAINTDDEMTVKISPIKKVVEGLRKALQVQLLFKKSSLLELSIKGPVKLKGQDILNKLVTQYNKDAIEDKNLIGNNTDAFINERLAVIEKDLSNVDKGVEDFKTINKLTDITSEAGLALVSNAELEKEIVELNTQLKLAAYVSTYIEANAEQLIPENLGLNDGAVNSNSTHYNELILERNRILKSSSKKHPVIVMLDAQLKQLRTSIYQSLVNLKSSLNITLAAAKKQERRFHSRITSVPKQERQYRDIQRQQQIIETLYLYLLEKREENAISLAVTVPNAKVIDTAEGSDIPVSPKRKIVYMAALLLGVLIPFMVLYILLLLDTKIHSGKELETLVKAPLLGEIPKTKSQDKIVVSENDRDSIAESFRMLRTNLNFMLSGTKEKGKTIFVTSTIPEEGKTFISLNLSAVLSLSNKKVLLIGADIRKPKFMEYLNVKFGKGLTHFLMDDTLKVKDVIDNFPEFDFDILSSGLVPPNPSELLMNGRFEEVLRYAKENYDYVIVDTAPVKMVTDTLLLGHQADACLYVVRANFLDKRLLEIPEKLYKDKRLPNMSLVMNDMDMERGYGYGYGYGEDIPKESWRKRIFNF